MFWYQEKVRQTYEPKVVSVCVYSSNWLSMARQGKSYTHEARSFARSRGGEGNEVVATNTRRRTRWNERVEGGGALSSINRQEDSRCG